MTYDMLTSLIFILDSLDPGSQQYNHQFDLITKCLGARQVWRYNNSTNTIWLNFDEGCVLAENYGEAKRLAKEEIQSELDHINSVLGSKVIEMNLDEIRVDQNELDNDKCAKFIASLAKDVVKMDMDAVNWPIREENNLSSLIQEIDALREHVRLNLSKSTLTRDRAIIFRKKLNNQNDNDCLYSAIFGWSGNAMAKRFRGIIDPGNTMTQLEQYLYADEEDGINHAESAQSLAIFDYITGITDLKPY